MLFELLLLVKILFLFSDPRGLPLEFLVLLLAAVLLTATRSILLIEHII